MRALTLVLLALASAPAGAQVYKCIEGGKTVFSGVPCEAGAQPEVVRPAAGSYNREEGARRRAETLDAQAQANRADREREMNRRLAANEHDRKKQAEINRCNQMKRDRERAAQQAKEFRYKENIQRAEDKAKQLESREFFECR